MKEDERGERLRENRWKVNDKDGKQKKKREGK